MADRHRHKARIRLSENDYEYLCSLAKRLDSEFPNCTEALRRIIREHRLSGVGHKWGTSDCITNADTR